MNVTNNQREIKIWRKFMKMSEKYGKFFPIDLN